MMYLITSYNYLDSSGSGKGQWQDLMNTGIIRFQKWWGISWLTEWLLASQGGLCSMELVSSVQFQPSSITISLFVPLRVIDSTATLSVIDTKMNAAQVPNHTSKAWNASEYPLSSSAAAAFLLSWKSLVDTFWLIISWQQHSLIFTVKWLVPLPCIQEVVGSFISLQARYPDRFFMIFHISSR